MPLQGKDDMRADQRLMQMVRLADSLMQADRRAAGKELHTRPFGMTPLGPRMGLVQWVEHTLPIFEGSRAATASATEPGKVSLGVLDRSCARVL